MGNRMDYVSSFILCIFIFVNLTAFGSADTSSKSTNASPSAKNEVQKDSHQPKSERQPPSPNSEGESQVLESTRKPKPAKRTAEFQGAPRSQKVKSPSAPKTSKVKKLKTKSASGKKVDRSSAENDWNPVEFADDEDIHRKATERTSTWADDYDWGPDVDWDALDNNSRIFDLDSTSSSEAESKPAKLPRKTRKPAQRKSMTVGLSSRDRTSEVTESLKPLIPKIIHPKPQTRPRGFEDSESEAEDETALIVEYTDEDYSVTYDDDEDEDVYSDDTSDHDETEVDYSEDSDYSDYDESMSSKKSHTASDKALKRKISDKKPSKRKMALKKKRTWIKQQKKERKSDKRKRRGQSINGMRKVRGRSNTNRRRSGRDEDNRSRATRLGIRRKLDGRDYGRNAGKQVFWREKKRFFRGPRRKFPLRGKARDNVRRARANRG